MDALREELFLRLLLLLGLCWGKLVVAVVITVAAAFRGFGPGSRRLRRRVTLIAALPCWGVSRCLRSISCRVRGLDRGVVLRRQRLPPGPTGRRSDWLVLCWGLLRSSCLHSTI